MSSKHIAFFSLLTIFFILFIAACEVMPSPSEQTSEEITDSFPNQPTNTLSSFIVIYPKRSSTPTATTEPTISETIAPSSTPTITATPDVRLDPKDWQNWPVIPVVSGYTKELYQQGLLNGRDPNRFSKVGDCQNITTYFLAMFDFPNQYSLGEDCAYLGEVINQFSGSFSRESVATDGGMNVAAVLSYRWADQEKCENLESPLACELRLQNPSIVLISMEETWGRDNQVENYEKYMRQVIETVIDFGAVPILATKASNIEGNHQINQVIANLAYEYDIPMWNFWLAVQPLPNHGLLADGFHLTHGLNFFDDPRNLKNAWPVRNLTALQVIDAVWRQVNDLPVNGE
jgi:hypothetical protein